MKKISILKRKLYRAYNNKDNRNYSISKGYPKDTYFGYDSYNSLEKDTIKDFIDYYGKGLRKWKSKKTN